MLREKFNYFTGCKLDTVKGGAEMMERLRQECKCEKCTQLCSDLFDYRIKEKDYNEMRELILVQNISSQLEAFTKKQKEKILEEVMINENINIEVAGEIPGSLKPLTGMLSIL
jgi:hypothetical protein